MYTIIFRYIQSNLHNPCNVCQKKIIRNNVADCCGCHVSFVNYFVTFRCLVNMKSKTSL